ncbi:uncharacterized protein BJ212DRAFT_417224 [Suillus subaureus]|uniref:Uncharacterized protein n=1 Tax=Suillus subaureus TaxID=48587 RepID=A0A9P7E718_9AGAM|nr:uncharacterized protein BJ212DRAFT_417224 [Suillus subaureus]KAG1813200.1 hypothetical protein BJ212DRAFT_417224 [Suillus subaureus]
MQGTGDRGIDGGEPSFGSRRNAACSWRSRMWKHVRKWNMRVCEGELLPGSQTTIPDAE